MNKDLVVKANSVFWNAIPSKKFRYFFLQLPCNISITETCKTSYFPGDFHKFPWKIFSTWNYLNNLCEFLSTFSVISTFTVFSHSMYHGVLKSNYGGRSECKIFLHFIVLKEYSTRINPSRKQIDPGCRWTLN